MICLDPNVAPNVASIPTAKLRCEPKQQNCLKHVSSFPDVDDVVNKFSARY